MDVPDASALVPILAGLGLPPAKLITPLRGGSAEVFRLDLEDGLSLTLKSFTADYTVPEREVFAASLLSKLTIPVTRTLLVDESCERLPFRFALATYLEGRSAASFAGHRDYRNVLRQIGELAGQLHAIELPAFGELPEPRVATNADYVRRIFEHAFERFLYYGADPTLAAKLRLTFERDFESVVPLSTRAVFAHDDLQPNNVLVLEDGGKLRVSGLIDFGNARASSDVMDLAKTIFCCEHEVPGSRDAILAGYGAITHPSADKALEFYTTVHRLVMWWWLRHIGALPSADTPNDIMPALMVTAAGS